MTAPLIEGRGLTKRYGRVEAVANVDLRVEAGRVTCLLGDNGAGKSTIIKMLAGVHRPDAGTLLSDGEPVRLDSPRHALDLGIATVYQDLAMIPLMSIARNFVLGQEPLKGRSPLRRLDLATADRIARSELERIGINVRDTSQPVGTLSGGERQAVAIARAVHFGARVLILDEPTSALGVREAGIVLRYVARARAEGLGIVLITHNVHHAYPLGDIFTVLHRGRAMGTLEKNEVSMRELETQMAGGAEMEALAKELAETIVGRPQPTV